MIKTMREMKKEFKQQIEKVDKSLTILNNIEKQYETFDKEKLKLVLVDLIKGYKSTLIGLKNNYKNELK